MIDFGPTKLAFLGERNYLHSTDIFPVFLECLSSLSVKPGPDRVMSFKFHRETDRNGHVRLVEAGDNMQSRGPAADITFGRDDGQQWKFEFHDDGPKIERFRPAPPEKFSNISLQADFAGTVACSGIENDAEFFATLVECNKALHVATLARRGEPSSRAWRFIYCENMPIRSSRLRGSDFVFSFNHLGGRTSGSKSFTLNSVTADKDPSLLIRLCFSY